MLLCVFPWARSQKASPCPLSSPAWSCFSPMPYPQFFFLGWEFRASPLSFLLPQIHSLPALFSPRFGDDIPGMEGLGTGKLCRMLSCLALVLAQTDLIMGEDSGVPLFPWPVCISQGHQRTLVLPPQAATFMLCLHTLHEGKAIYVCFSYCLHWAAGVLVCFLLILWLRISAAWDSQINVKC